MSRPGKLLAVAAASYLVLIVGAVATPRSCFAPTWFDVFSSIFLVLGLLSTFAAVFEYGRGQGWHVVGSVIGAAVSTGLVGVLAVYATFALTIAPGCFS